jgi:hypothetical protein
MNWKRVLCLVIFSSALSVFAHANNGSNTDPVHNGDSLKVQQKSTIQGLIFFSFQKAKPEMKPAVSREVER